jgi:hypothetical protein
MSRQRLLAAATVSTLLLTATVALAALPPGGTFTDDDGNTHEGNIEAIAAEGITRGCNPPANDLYCPSDPLTRAQMAAFLHRAFPELPILFPEAGSFSDVWDPVVDTGTPPLFFEDIEWLAQTGVTRGCNPPANTKFCPDDPITRGQMAAFLVRAVGYTDDGGGDLFTDDDGSTFEGDIDKLATAGVTKGCNPPANDRYCPAELVKRDQMASFLARSLDLEPIDPPPPTTTTVPTTTTTSAVPPNPGDSKNCSDFDTWAEAQEWFDTYYPYYGDVAKLDANNDLIACESLPGAP